MKIRDTGQHTTRRLKRVDLRLHFCNCIRLQRRPTTVLTRQATSPAELKDFAENFVGTTHGELASTAVYVTTHDLDFCVIVRLFTEAENRNYYSPLVIDLW